MIFFDFSDIPTKQFIRPVKLPFQLTDILSTWNSILLFGETLFLLVETDFLASANHFFLPF